MQSRGGTSRPLNTYDFDAYLELVDHLETLLAVSVLGEALDVALSA